MSSRKQAVDLSAPTPQNTPANAAPISSRAQQPGLASLSEEGDLNNAAAAAMLANNPRLLSMVQNKLSGLVGQSSGYIESLPVSVRRRVAGLKGIQHEHSKLEAQFQEEVLALEKKYNKKFEPLYQKRSAIVNGQAEPTEEEVTAGETLEGEEDEDGQKPKIDLKAKDEEDSKPMNGIPEFWLSAMKNQPGLVDMITDADEGVLKHLKDVRMEYLEKPGFRLIFEFDENEFFSNKTITKTYHYQEETGYGGEYIYDHADGDKIEWKTGKDLTVRVEQKKQRNKSETSLDSYQEDLMMLTLDDEDTKQTRIVKKTVPTDSFFNFFSPPQPPAADEDDEVAEDIEERLELDYSLGEDIKEKLIPRAIDWFTGEALQFESIEDDFGEGDFEDEDDEDEDDLSDRDDDDDDSDEEGDGPRSQKQDAAECKQS